MLSDAVAADGNAQSEREVCGALPDGDPLRRVFHRQQVGGYEEVDPSGGEVHRQTHDAAPVVDDRVAARQREPPGGLEVHRAGEAVPGLELPEAGRVEQSDADLLAPDLVFDAGVERGVEALGGALRRGRSELQQVHVEVGLFGRLAVFDLHARELHAFDRAARAVVLLVPGDESQVGDGHRDLQLGQDVVGGAQVHGKAVSGGLVRLGREVAEGVGAVLVAGDVVACRAVGRQVERSRGVDAPAVFVEPDVHAVVVEPGAGHADEELGAGTEVELVVQQRERIGEARLEVGVGRDADVAHDALPAGLEELEERAGQVDVACRAKIQVEGPEVAAVFGVSAEAEDVDAGLHAEVVLGIQPREGVGRRDGAVEQRHELSVAREEHVAEGDVAARGDVDAAHARDVEEAALRRKGRVELAAEGRSLHEVGRVALSRHTGRERQRQQKCKCLFHGRRWFRG